MTGYFTMQSNGLSWFLISLSLCLISIASDTRVLMHLPYSTLSVPHILDDFCAISTVFIDIHTLLQCNVTKCITILV
jgi:hypothetical protein